jgi:hypothetical protein
LRVLSGHLLCFRILRLDDLRGVGHSQHPVSVVHWNAKGGSFGIEVGFRLRRGPA